MTSELNQRLRALSSARLKAMQRGVEKESLRLQPAGALALTPHPQAFGSALTHPHITTDFCESQLELITGVHADAQTCVDELTQIHQVVAHALEEAGDETLWVASMPCGHRYGRRMQTISGIHYNWSMPGLTNDDYFGLIRNFRRHSFVLLVLFGASPAVCSSFVAGRAHELQPLRGQTLHLPHATSLRMGRLGYQSDAQASLAVSYNSLESYAQSLQDGLTRPYPPYEAIGIRNPGGEYNQLSTTLLQIENEFYGTIRPKRVIHRGERPLHALRERGVEYVEVRCMDLDPFQPVGISAETMRFIDIFLLHCLLSDSPPDQPSEIAALARNQHLAAGRGRELGLMLERNGEPVTLVDWGAQVLEACVPIAAELDGVHGGALYRDALERAWTPWREPARLPSARVLTALLSETDASYVAFGRAQSQRTREMLLALPFPAALQERFAALAAESVAAQSAIEAADTMPFEIYRQEYLATRRLGVSP